MAPTDATQPPVPIPLPGEVPRTVGPYRLLAPLGEGGIGTVYRAEHQPTGRRVALKLLRAELNAHAEVVARFEREAAAMAALAHENVVRSIDFGRTDAGQIYLVIELAEGETLRTTLQRGAPLPLAWVVAVTRQVGAALAHAHALGIVHRDLKPENVMVADDGGRPRVKVLDFGMARVLGGLLAGQTPLTKQGSVFGTPEYMPPEQASGRPVDGAADQYALGVMAFEMLAGRRPFRASSPLEMLQKQIHEAPPPLATLAPQVPAAVAAVVAKMMAKRREERFVDVATAVAALASAASVGAVTAAPRAPSPPGSAAPASAAPHASAQALAPRATAPHVQRATPPHAPSDATRWRLIGAVVIAALVTALAIGLQALSRSIAGRNPDSSSSP